MQSMLIAKTRKTPMMLVMINCSPSIALLFLLLPTVIASEPITRLLLPPGLAESHLVHINQVGDAIGRCEIFNSKGSSVVDFACKFSKGSVTPLPKLIDYRKMECVAISDSGVVVGHAYSPEQEQDAVLQAVIFDSDSGNVLALPNLLATKATLATAISRDGKTIVGVCSGQACVWVRKQKSWAVSAMPQSAEGLSTQRVCLSDNGKIAVAFQRRNQHSQLSQWSLDEQGNWRHAVRLEGDITPYDVNNTSVIVGNKEVQSASLPETRGFVLMPDNKIEVIEPFEGDNFSTARSINNKGAVVGWSDSVGDASKWPRSFVWVQGKLQTVETVPARTPSQAYGINDNGEVVGLLEREDDLHAVGFVTEINVPH